MLKKIILTTTLVTVSVFGLTMLHSCKKSSNCYDAEMAKNHSGICTMDCPGVTGCDGKTYCNECIANSVGIRVN